MKKFSTIGKIDLTDDQPKTYAETIDGLFESIVSYKISGENSELAGKIDITLEGKHEFIAIVEKLTKIHIMKERTKLLEGFKHKVYKSGNLNWVDNDINAINESIDILINGGKLASDFDITIDKNVNLSENKNTKTYKDVITDYIINGYHHATAAQCAILDKTATAIRWAWDNWDDKVVSTYYKDKKPVNPTPDFIEEWVNNNDFTEDGYDDKKLKELF